MQYIRATENHLFIQCHDISRRSAQFEDQFPRQVVDRLRLIHKHQLLFYCPCTNWWICKHPNNQSLSKLHPLKTPPSVSAVSAPEKEVKKGQIHTKSQIQHLASSKLKHNTKRCNVPRRYSHTYSSLPHYKLKNY